MLSYHGAVFCVLFCVHQSHKWVLFKHVAVYLVGVRADEGDARLVHQYLAVKCQS